MKKIEDAHKAIQTLIHLATKLPLNRVIKSRQGQNLPRGNSCFYKLTPLRTIGAPYKLDTPIAAVDCDIEDWEDKEQILYQKMLMTASVHFYGSDAPDNCMKLKRCNHLHSISGHLYQNNIQWSGAGMPNDLSELLEAKIQQRFHIDINFVVDAESDSEIILMAHSIRYEMDDDN